MTCTTTPAGRQMHSIPSSENNTDVERIEWYYPDCNTIRAEVYTTSGKDMFIDLFKTEDGGVKVTYQSLDFIPMFVIDELNTRYSSVELQ